jgi:hypothetical protein
MTVGFTGTRNGMTPPQRETVGRLLQSLRPDKTRDGLGVGADAEFAALAASLSPRPFLVGHPGVSSRGGGNERRGDDARHDIVLAEQTHFKRNRVIVDNSDVLVAAPPCQPLPESGGTAYTVGYARKVAKPLVVVWPDGTTTEENR